MNTIDKYFFSIALIILYLLEGLSKYFMYVKFESIKVTRYLKLIILIYVILYFVYTKSYRLFITPIILFFFFLLGHYFMGFKFINFELIIVFTKYIFPIFILEYSYFYFKRNKNIQFFKVFEVIVIFNSILIFLGVIFNIFLFKTYGNNRFGYNGLLITSATSSYFYIIALYYYFVIKRGAKRITPLFLFIIIMSLLVGTKSIFLFIIFLLGFKLITYNKLKFYNKFFNFLILCFSLIVFFLVLEPKFIEIEKTEGLLSSLLSYRDILFKEKTLPFIKENWSFLNFIIGGNGPFKYRTQMGFIDLFFFFGLLGSLLYLFVFVKSLFKGKYDMDMLFLILSVSCIIFLGGNFFYSATITIYLIVLQQILLFNQNVNKIK